MMNKQSFNNSLKALIYEASYRKKAYVSAVALATVIAGGLAVGLNSMTPMDGSAAECPSGTCNTSFQVNVQDSLAVSITSMVSGATGNVNEFLRNQIDVSVNSNVDNGFTASMYSKDTTNLTHTMLGSSYYIPSMSSSTSRSSFPTNTWGYSLKSASLDGKTYGETDAGNNSSTYYPLTTSEASPIKIMSAAAGTKTGSQSVYFGAKANIDKPSGTYSNTVIISVVTGAIDSTTNPITPTNPVTPDTDPTPNDSVAVYTGANTTTGTGISGSNGTTVYTTTSYTPSAAAPITKETTTQVSAGDHRSSYAPAQGVSVTSQSDIVEGGSGLPVALAATAVTAATAGVVFFLLAKRDEDDDEEAEY